MVAYAVGPQFVRRVLEGFLAEGHEVVFPSLGVMCVDAVGGGALIQVVRPNSPAAVAGVAVGDVLLDVGGTRIQDQLDFARAMLRQEVGKKVPLRLRRGSLIQIRDVVIGRAGE
jgi:S1-C subfamily serine protease